MHTIAKTDFAVFIVEHINSVFRTVARKVFDFFPNSRCGLFGFDLAFVHFEDQRSLQDRSLTQTHDAAFAVGHGLKHFVANRTRGDR